MGTHDIALVYSESKILCGLPSLAKVSPTFHLIWTNLKTGHWEKWASITPVVTPLSVFLV